MANKRTMDLIKAFEGLVKVKSDGLVHVYADVGYGWRWATQGYGTTVDPDTGKKLHRGSPPITKDQALRWLRMDIERKYEPKVRRLVKVPLSADSMGALVSFAYNCGTGALARSTLLKRVNARDWDAVPNQFLRWNKSNGRVFRGLTRRRKAESKQFMEGLAHKPAERPPAVELPIPPLPSRNPSRGNLGRSTGFVRAITRWFTNWFR